MLKAIAYILMLLFIVLFLSSCTSTVNSNQTGSKKFYVQPVCLTVSGIEKDTSIKNLFNEAFADYGVKLITKEEMIFLAETEGKRIGQKVFTKDAKLSGADDIIKAMSKEHRYNSNILGITLQLEEKDDSIVILKASWSNMPSPPDIGRGPVGTKNREIDLTSLTYGRRENIYAIVDSILYSKELK